MSESKPIYLHRNDAAIRFELFLDTYNYENTGLLVQVAPGVAWVRVNCSLLARIMGSREPHGAPGQWSLNPMISSTPVDLLLVSEMSGLTMLSTRLLNFLIRLIHFFFSLVSHWKCGVKLFMILDLTAQFTNWITFLQSDSLQLS